MSQIEVEQAALQMPIKARAFLAQKLLESIEQPSEAELEQLWLIEIGERIKRVERGESKLVSFSEALQQARAVIAKTNG
jgi:CMP-2-keto-3-deoxyoctulosonic acid synthetase